MRRLLTSKWFALLAVALLMLSGAAPVGYLMAERWRCQSALDALTRRLDRDDPGWRLDDIARATNAKLPPDDRNPFVLATAANATVPADFAKRLEKFPDWSKSEPNRTLDPAAKAKLLAAMRGFEPALDAARDLADLPDAGGNVVVVPANPMTRVMDGEQDLRLTAALLRADATLLAEEGKMGEAVRSVRAALGTARALGDDPSLTGQLVRVAVASVAGRAAESVLNLGEPDAGLAELQAEFLREAAAPKLVVGLRGDCGVAVSICQVVAGRGRYGHTDLARLIDLLTRYSEAAKLPPERQAAVLAGIPVPAVGDSRYRLTNLLLPAVEKVSAATRRGHGELVAVAVGIACERHRRRLGQWPATLADIPADILPAVPTDPCDGLPIKYKRHADRIAVYSVGPDGTDHGGDLSESTPKEQRDYGIRLYDVPHRRQPAPPGDAP